MKQKQVYESNGSDVIGIRLKSNHGEIDNFVKKNNFKMYVTIKSALKLFYISSVLF